MITQHEARQRCALNRMSFRRDHTGDYRINFVESDNEATAYYTDCLLDAVITAGNMRKCKRDADAARFAFGHAISCTV